MIKYEILANGWFPYKKGDVITKDTKIGMDGLTFKEVMDVYPEDFKEVTDDNNKNEVSFWIKRYVEVKRNELRLKILLDKIVNE